MGLIEDLYSDENIMRIKGVILREGVWNDIYVPGDVLESSATSLLGKYVMLGHPAADTEPNWPEQALGQVVNVEFDPEAGELWAEMVLWKNRIPEDLLRRLESGEVIPVSSGHLSYDDDETGTVGGKTYTKRTRKMYFEHVGIVSAGACDVADGCGVFLDTEPESELIEGEGADEVPSGTAVAQPTRFACPTGRVTMLVKSNSKEVDRMGSDSVTRTLFAYPVIDSSSGEIAWQTTDSQEVAAAKSTELVKSLADEMKTAKIEAEKLKGELDKLTGEVNVVRETLVGELKKLMPGAPDDVISRYAGMGVSKLREFVTDLKTYVAVNGTAPAESAPAAQTEPVKTETVPAVSEPDRVLNSDAPTRVTIQSVCAKKPVSVKDAINRLKAETGIKKFMR
ncbi:MAG: DUF2213 domain-containing protein [Methanothrix sp.]|nr:DUF2213 domain-containing protein [Methanothrix sp.]